LPQRVTLSIVVALVAAAISVSYFTRDGERVELSGSEFHQLGCPLQGRAPGS